MNNTLFLFFLVITFHPVFGQDQETDLQTLTRLSKALQFKTISAETHPNHARDYNDFILWIRENFPLVHQKLEHRIVNNYSLLYEWKGTDASLLPGLFVAHYDVVPAEGSGTWVYPPFSGHMDGEFIWGRGALDNKSQMLGMLESVEDLVRQNISPRRTLFFAFGHDEESGGDQGAGHIKSYFNDRGLRFEFILDEGGAMMKDVFPGTSATFAAIGTAEKGYLDIELSVRAVGGHSSVPPMENAIEILSIALVKLNNQGMPLKLQEPTVGMLKAIAPHMKFATRMAIRLRFLFKKKLLLELSKNPATNTLVRTVLSPTLVGGGSKENILPDSAFANINVRLTPGETVESVTEHVQKVIKDDRISIAWKLPYYNASPVTRTDTEIWYLLTEAIKAEFPGVVPAPVLFPATTDSHHYQLLSDNILRFSPITISTLNSESIHGVNERIAKVEYIQVIKFYTKFILAN